MEGEARRALEGTYFRRCEMTPSVPDDLAPGAAGGKEATRRFLREAGTGSGKKAPFSRAASRFEAPPTA